MTYQSRGGTPQQKPEEAVLFAAVREWLGPKAEDPHSPGKGFGWGWGGETRARLSTAAAA